MMPRGAGGLLGEVRPAPVRMVGLAGPNQPQAGAGFKIRRPLPWPARRSGSLASTLQAADLIGLGKAVNQDPFCASRNR